MSGQSSSIPAVSSNPEATVNVVGSPSASSPILGSLISDDSSSIRTYTPLKTISQGPFGSVHFCHWHSIFPPCVDPPPLPTIARYGVGRDLVALKVIPMNSGQDPNKWKELEVLRNLPPHPNVVFLYDYFFTLADRKLHLAFGAMEGNLQQLIQARRSRSFAGALLSSIFYQLNLALDHIHSHHYFHRDLVPENVLVTTTGLFDYPTFPIPLVTTSVASDTLREKDVVVIIKLADFGLARDTRSGHPYTEYVTTRWYRAPEVLLSSPHYTSAVDMWAFGAIIAEMLNLRPIFPGTDSLNQIATICDVLGNPSNEYRLDAAGRLINGGSWPDGLALAHSVGFQFPEVLRRPLSSFFSSAVPTSLVQLMEEFLVFNPQHRLTSSSSLQHPYFLHTAPYRNSLPPPVLDS
ncbi:hypothetical protein M413DRAFT_446540 [Hebeloma cylindrosporum]|uniref:Protein kinase domain-containing protein n=1 Tax=Hebeloma cylindrosporum TaxID=76867 RepID=A0A0C3BUK1_HEBCY|nr:hypothetical protein M413DRAFT_446540 [Hebeloma cylindrosporum h7]